MCHQTWVGKFFCPVKLFNFRNVAIPCHMEINRFQHFHKKQSLRYMLSPTFLQAKQSQLSVSLYVTWSISLINFLTLHCTHSRMSIFSCSGEPKTWHSTADGLSQTLRRGKGSPSLTNSVILFLMLPYMLLVFFAARTHCWLMLSLLSTRVPAYFSAQVLSKW